jgi:hypothetical protein
MQTVHFKERFLKPYAEPADDGATFTSQAPEHLNHIFQYENALNELLKCSLRVRKLGC